MQSSFSTAIGQAAARAFCGFLGVQQNAFDYASSAGFPGFEAAANAARGWRLGVCSNPNGDTLPPSPFSGGQCAVRYFVNYTARGVYLGQQDNITTTFESDGPISSPFAETLEEGGAVWGWNAAGQRLEVLQRGGLVGGWEEVSTTINSVTRADGQADNCGNPPPPVVRRPPFNIGPIDITYNDNNNSPTIVAGNAVILAPIIGSFNRVSFPINVDVGGVTFKVSLGGDGDISVEPPTFPSVGPSDDLPSPTGSEDPEPPDSDRPIIGVMVVIISLNKQRASVIQQPGLPRLFVPRLATVQFRIKSKNNYGWTIDAPVKTLACYVPCPEPRGAVSVGVSPQPGVLLDFSPVYEKVPATEK